MMEAPHFSSLQYKRRASYNIKEANISQYQYHMSYCMMYQVDNLWFTWKVSSREAICRMMVGQISLKSQYSTDTQNIFRSMIFSGSRRIVWRETFRVQRHLFILWQVMRANYCFLRFNETFVCKEMAAARSPRWSLARFSLWNWEINFGTSWYAHICIWK